MNYPFLYHIDFYENKKLAAELNQKAEILFQKINLIHTGEIGFSDYGKGYFNQHKFELRYLLQMINHILYHLLKDQKKPFHELTIIDHGGGIGFLSLMCNALNINVLYNDIYPVIGNDFDLLVKELRLSKIDIFIGEIQDVTNYCLKKNIKIDAIVSSEVIEHIYDIDSFFEHLNKIPSEDLNFVFSTSANMLNPYRNHKIKKMQIRAELFDQNDYKGRRQIDSLSSFFNIRKNLIREHFPELNENQVIRLTKYTRGKNKPDLIQSVQNYISSEIMPTELKHKTNTCDTLTGNWTEHLMNPFELSNKLSKLSFKTTVISGFYGSNSNGKILNSLKYYLNRIINLFGINGVYLSHFWMLKGYKSK